MPRRQRVYTTVDQLSMRYRVLDLLVKGLFPDHDVDSLHGLLALADEKGIEVPQEESQIAPLDPRGASNGEGASDAPSPPVVQEQRDDPSLQDNSVAPSDDAAVPEGWLVPAPNGGYHYIGTASLVYFAHTARRLVSKSNLATMPSYDEAGLRTFLRTAEFTTYQVSHAIADSRHGNPLAPTSEDAADLDQGSSSSGPTSPMYKRPVDMLPDRATSDLLVEAFFNHAHPNFPIFHRGAFQVKYESTWRNSGQQPLTQDPGWMASLLMVFVIGAQKLEGDLGGQPQALHQKCLSILFRDGLERIVLSSTLSNVQALLLLSLYQHNVGERNSAWLLVGQAARSAIALGMHRDGGEDSKFDPFERNTRRLVWWTLYMFEQTVSLALGRPSFTETVSVTASLPDATFTSSIVGLPPNFLQHSIELSRLHKKIRRFIGTLSPHYAAPSKLAEACPTANRLLAELSRWRTNLPSQLAPSYAFVNAAQRRAVLLMHIWSYYLESIIARAFILGRVDHDIPSITTAPAPAPPPLSSNVAELAERCVQAAHSSVKLLLELEASGQLEGCVYLDFYAIYHATMIIGIHFLSRPLGLDAADVELKATISTLLARSKGVSVAPTYRILMNIAMPLAYIAGIAPETVETTDTTPAAASSATNLTPRDEQWPGPPYNMSPQAHPQLFPRGEPPAAFSQSAAIGRDQPTANLGDPSSLTALEQLFGPIPQFQQSDLRLDAIADLYAIGFDPNDVNPRTFAM